MTRRPILAFAALALTAGLTACGPGTGTPTGSPSGSGAETPITTLPPIDGGVDLPADAVLHIATTVTALNGATLDLTMTVHKSTAFDDPAAADRPATFTAGCQGGYDESIYADQLFSFATIDVTATAGTGTWPTDGDVQSADDLVYLFPDTTYLSLASTGDLLEASVADSETPHCKRDRVVAGAGAGTLVVGFHGDTDDVGAAGGFTRWANHNYGFTVDGTDLVFSGCTLTVTPLGEEFGWSDADQEYVTDQFCRFGIAEGEDTDS